MTAHLSEEERDYLTAIDLQINSITRSHDPHDDYDKALGDLVVQLEELKSQITTAASISAPAIIDRPVTRSLTRSQIINESGRPGFTQLITPPSVTIYTVDDFGRPRFRSPLTSPQSDVSRGSSTPGRFGSPTRPMSSSAVSAPARSDLFFSDLYHSISSPTRDPTPLRPTKPDFNSNAASQSASASNAPTRECNICLESYPVEYTRNLKCCKTIYCQGYFRRWLRTSFSAKQLPRCCKQLFEPGESYCWAFMG